MKVLVVNCGSSSVKVAVVDTQTGGESSRHKVERIGREGHPANHKQALAVALAQITMEGVEAVGHRVVHGGETYTRPTRIDDSMVERLQDLVPLAPLHLPANVAGIAAARQLLPGVAHVAVFDTAFHATLPRRARAYAVPQEWVEAHGIRRYGFHGPSHSWVAGRAAQFLEEDVRSLRIITCHLGNGCSVAAVEYGRSVETSMGLTPLEGLVMGTRVGDVDVGAVLHVARAEGLDLDELDHVLNRKSGLAGLSGVGNDMRDIEERAGEGDERCRAAINVFAHRLRKYIGAYAAVLGGVDAIVFTGGIGENSALIRHRVAQRLDFLGARLDEDANRVARVGPDAPTFEISTAHSRCRILVVATDEERSIACDVAEEVGRAALPEPRAIPVAISARHVHLTDEVVQQLFGPGHTLTPRMELSQPGQFACEETVALIGPKRTLDEVRIIGPIRSACQVEIARTDEFFLGIDAPIRCSGDLDHTPGITLEGPAGRVVLERGVIQAQRHIHMTPGDADYFDVKHKDIVEVAIDSEGRDITFGDVVVRVSDRYRLEMHVDTDEGNAAQTTRDICGVLIETRDAVRLTRR